MGALCGCLNMNLNQSFKNNWFKSVFIPKSKESVSFKKHKTRWAVFKALNL